MIALYFFCGAGISVNNGLHLFNELVEKVCKKLNIDIDNEPLLNKARERGNYDGILDLVEGNQSFSVSRQTLRKEIITILNNYTEETDTHKSLLELSALPDNKGHRLVTTNFDKLFFKAGLESKLSDSAPKLAPPRKETWKNLTFLHGVIDTNQYPEGDNLILTRRDFGLAYLHDNWAARFIIQLFQDFTVLFIGYSVADPVMNYLVSAISYENQRRKRNEIKIIHHESFNGNQKNEDRVKPSIYAFVGYSERGEEEERNKWKSLGIEPIPYKIKGKNDHSLLYDTINQWAILKKTGLVGRKNWLKNQLKSPYQDFDKAKTVISFLKTDEKLAEYFSQINLSTSPDSKKILPVDISWLKPFSERGVLEKLTHRTYDTQSPAGLIWEPLSELEKNIAKWLLHHLDKKELIHWLIDHAPNRDGLVCLHPEFKELIRVNLRHIEKHNDNTILYKRKSLFWQIITTQENHSENLNPYGGEFLITELNQEYSPIKAKELLLYLEPQIGFETYFYCKELREYEVDDRIYEPKLKINMKIYPYQQLTDEKTLLFHAEDFSNLLKKAMELAELSGTIQNGYDLFYIKKPSIAEHSQNRNFHPWTYLIDLTRDSFDISMEKDQKLAQFLLYKWQFYPYPTFYRLLLYAVTKHFELSEETAVNLLKKENHNILWSSPCQNEVLKYLKNRRHSKLTIEKLLPLIIKGPPRSLFREDIDDNIFTELKERAIYQRLHCLKISGVQLTKDIETYFNKIPSKYSFKPSTETDDLYDFPFFHAESKWEGAEESYHNLTPEQIFNRIKYTKPNTYPDVHRKKEDFLLLIKDHPDKAFKVLLRFPNEDMNSAPYWGAFVSEVSMIRDTKTSNKYALKAFQKIETFNDEFIRECLLSVIYGFNLKGALIYEENKNYFKKWWDRLWQLSILEIRRSQGSSDFSSDAINSPLGKLSQSIFNILRSNFPESTPKNGKIPDDIKDYFNVIIREGAQKNPSTVFRFGSQLWILWFLDKDWVKNNLKPLMDWEKNQDICKALWSGYSYHIKLSIDFLSDFKTEFFYFLLHSKNLYTQESRDKIGYCESIAEIFLITTGCKWTMNIFTEQEIRQLIKNIDIDVLEAISRKIWYLLKDSGDKSANLWSEKIKPWIEKFWPQQEQLKTSQIAKNLSFVILHCREKVPEAFEILKDNIKEKIQQNNNYISHYIKENMKQELSHIFDNPKKLLCLLNWNFPKDRIEYYYSEEIREILKELKVRHTGIEKDKQYEKLLEKLPVHN